MATEGRQGGTLFRLRDSGFDELEVVARWPAGSERFRLAVRRPSRPAFLEEARGRARSGDLDEARALLEAQLAGPLDDRWRGPALGLLARVEERAGRPLRARDLINRAVAGHQRRGDLGREISDRCFLVRIEYYDLGDFAAALAALQQVPHPSPGDADSAYLASVYRGTLALYTGDSRAALSHLAAAGEQRDRLGDAQGRWVSSQMLARLLRRLGRTEEAGRLLEELTSDRELLGKLDSCQQAELFNNVGWDRLLSLEAGSAAGDPLPPLRRALEALDAGRGCPSTEKPSVELNHALAYLHRGDLTKASQHLESARRKGATSSPRLLLWQLDLEARLDQELGRLERAEVGFRRLAELAVRASSLEAEWRASFGLARVAEATARPEAALEAYARAEDLLDEVSRRAPLGLGRATSAASGEGATRRYLELLLDQGLDQRALQVARRSRSRILRGLLLEERVANLDAGQRARWRELLGRHERLAGELDRALAAEWQLAAADRPRADLERRRQRRELVRLLDQALALLDSRGLAAATGPLVRDRGETALVYHPVSGGGWVGFAVDADGMTAARLGEISRELPLEELSRRLFDPFLPRLAPASKVRVLDYGWLRDLDFHALPFGGGNLLDRAAVAYGLDLPRRGNALPPGTPRRALVIGDPTETLPAVGAETAAVAARLRRLEFAVNQLAGPAADRGTVLAGLGSSSLLHFAGHAERSDGLEGALRLAAQSRLSVGDVLAAPALPPSVVLAACHSGRSSTEAPSPSLGLAQAFLIAGSREVVATAREVDDGTAAEVVATLFRHWDGAGSLAEALRRAQLELGKSKGRDWAGFRVLER